MTPQRDQEPPERDMVRHAGVADRTEKHGIVGPQWVEPVFRHHAAGLGVGLAAPVEFAPLQRKAVAPRCRFQRVDALRHDFAPDAVAGDNGDPICPGHRLPPLCGGRLAHSAGLATARLSRPAIVAEAGYLFVFQMSVASCHCPPIFRHTTTYLPVTCSGGCAFVLKLNVPISRAAPGPSDWTSTVVSLASPSCFTAPPQNFSIALCPFAITAPAGSTYASGVYIAAKAFASPLLKAAIHSAFSFSIELLACAQAGEADSRKQARKIAMRAIGTLPGRGGLSRDFAQCAILRCRSRLRGKGRRDRRL